MYTYTFAEVHDILRTVAPEYDAHRATQLMMDMKKGVTRDVDVGLHVVDGEVAVKLTPVTFTTKRKRDEEGEYARPRPKRPVYIVEQPDVEPYYVYEPTSPMYSPTSPKYSPVV